MRRGAAHGPGMGGRGRIRVIGIDGEARVLGDSEDALSPTGIMTVNSGIGDRGGTQ